MLCIEQRDFVYYKKCCALKMLCIKKDGEKDVVYTNSIHDIFFCMYTTYRVLLVGNTDVLNILFLPKSG